MGNPKKTPTPQSRIDELSPSRRDGNRVTNQQRLAWVLGSLLMLLLAVEGHRLRDRLGSAGQSSALDLQMRGGYWAFYGKVL